MIIEKGYVLQELKPYEINRELVRIKDVVNGRVGIGQLSGRDRNLDGVMVVHTFVAANVEEEVIHDLNSVPVGYLTITNSNGGVIYDGTTRTTKFSIFLRSTTANNRVTLFILR